MKRYCICSYIRKYRKSYIAFFYTIFYFKRLFDEMNLDIKDNTIIHAICYLYL